MSKKIQEVEDPDLLVKKNFQEELDKLDEVYDEINALYDETYEHFSEIKGSMTRGSLAFVHLQTSNLISLKTAKLSVLKDRVTIKKSMYDIINKAKMNEVGSSSAEAQALEIYKLIKKENNSINDEIEEVPENDDSDNRLKKRMKKLMDEDPSFLTDNEHNMRFEGQNIVIMVKRFVSKKTKEKTWKFVAFDIDSEELVSDYVVPIKKNFDMSFVKDNGEVKAVDQNERVYKIFNG